MVNGLCAILMAAMGFVALSMTRDGTSLDNCEFDASKAFTVSGVIKKLEMGQSARLYLCGCER
jgi:hypothetical protein